jgi:hypothetical protein
MKLKEVYCLWDVSKVGSPHKKWYSVKSLSALAAVKWHLTFCLVSTCTVKTFPFYSILPLYIWRKRIYSWPFPANKIKSGYKNMTVMFIKKWTFIIRDEACLIQIIITISTLSLAGEITRSHANIAYILQAVTSILTYKPIHSFYPRRSHYVNWFFLLFSYNICVPEVNEVFTIKWKFNYEMYFHS